MNKQTVTINGIVFDTATGKAISQTKPAEPAPAKRQNHSAAAMHQTTQRSTTLNRRYVRRPSNDTLSTNAPVAAPVISTMRRTVSAPAEISQSAKISRFAPDNLAKQATSRQPIPISSADIEPATHPIVQQLSRQTAQPSPLQRYVKPSSIIKQEAIAEATAAMPSRKTRNRPKRTKQKLSFAKLMSAGSAAFAVLLIGAYFTYLSMPAISTRVAASQAGISASFPSYHPMGYSLNGPVAYQTGKVSMKFASNGGPESYTLSQTKTSWDSRALLSNYVTPKAGDNYTTSTANGLTIYTYGNNSVWVSGGILYTISGSAVLSNSQIQRIAVSL